MVTKWFDTHPAYPIANCSPAVTDQCIHGYIFTDGNFYPYGYVLIDRDAISYPATVRVPDARSAADAPGGEHNLADR